MFKDFINFVREQGVVGLAVGFIVGNSVSKVVKSLVDDIVSPILGLALGAAEGLQQASFFLAGAEIRLGNFMSVLIDFIVVASVVYFIVKGAGLDKLDKKKEKAAK